MAIAVASSVGYTESGTPSTAHALTGVTMAAGNGRLIAIATRGSVLTSSVADSSGAVYRSCAAPLIQGGVSIEVWVTTAASPAALSSGTVTVTTTAAVGVAFRVYELSGASTPLTNFFFVSGASWNYGTANTAINSGTGAASIFSTDLAFCAYGCDGAATVSASNFTAGAATATNIDSSTTTGSVVQLVTAYRVMTATTAQAYTATLGTARNWVALGARFYAGGLTYSESVRVRTTAPKRTTTANTAGPAAVVVTFTSGQFIPDTNSL